MTVMRGPDTPPSLGVFRSESGRTEAAITGDGRLNIHVLKGRDQLTDRDVNALRWALDRYDEEAPVRRAR